MPVNENGKTFPVVWNTLYSFQQLGLLCDVQLQVQNEDRGTLETFHAHMLILAASSAYFKQSAENSTDWEDVYFFDGSSPESVTLVLKYIYHQVDFITLQDNPEALKLAEALQIIKNLDLESKSKLTADQTSQNTEKNTQNCCNCDNKESSLVSPPELKSIACQTNLENNSMSYESSTTTKVMQRRDKKKPSPVLTDNRTKPYSARNRYPILKQSDATKKKVSIESVLADLVHPAQEDGSGVRRSRRMTKLSQKMKDYVSLKFEVAEGLGSDEEDEQDSMESEAESKMVISHQSPTEQVNAVQESTDSAKTLPKERDDATSADSPETSSPPKEKNLKNEPLDKGGVELKAKTPNDLGKTNGELKAKTPTDWAKTIREKKGHFPCSDCPILCATQLVLARHIQKEHRNPASWLCEECEKVFTREIHYINHVKQVHKKAPFECKECGLKFIAKSGYVYHQKRHHGDKDNLKFSCDECGKLFFLKSELTTHKMFKHSDERPFSCESCHKTFKHKKDLRRHLATFHSEDRNYKCDVCERAFKTPGDLKKHKDLHESGKWSASGRRFPDGVNYPCSFCNKIFTKRIQQKTHERLQHTLKNAGTSFLCTACNRSFAIKHYLMQHIKHVHRARRHKCDNCDKMFMQNHDLSRHQAKCKGKLLVKKPFDCPHCGLSFTVKGNLTKHLKIPGRCKWQRNNISDLVVLVQDNSAVHKEDMEFGNRIPQEVAIDSEDASNCVMSVLNPGDGNQMESPVIMRHIDENIISISHYPGAELILEAVDVPEAAIETVVQMPTVQNETEIQTRQIFVIEDMVDTQNIVISNDDGTTLGVIAETETVTHPDVQ